MLRLCSAGVSDDVSTVGSAVFCVEFVCVEQPASPTMPTAIMASHVMFLVMKK